MEKRILGKTNLAVSVLGLGGAEIGFAPGITAGQVREILAEAIDAGLNIIDSAAAYLKSESLLGEALGELRKRVYLATKCGAIEGFARSDWSKAGILRSIEQSLKNFRTDYLDIVLLHSCGALEFMWGEAAEGLIAAREKGYVRFIGYSGDGSSALSAIQANCFDVLETSINIADQEALTLTLPLARQKNLGVIAKRPVANAAWRTGKLPENEYHHEYYRRLTELDYPFLKQPLSEAVAVALGFTLAQPGVQTAIVGTTRPGRWKENAALLEKRALSAPECEAIRRRWMGLADPTWVGQI